MYSGLNNRIETNHDRKAVIENAKKCHQGYEAITLNRSFNSPPNSPIPSNMPNGNGIDTIVAGPHDGASNKVAETINTTRLYLNGKKFSATVAIRSNGKSTAAKKPIYIPIIFSNT